MTSDLSGSHALLLAVIIWTTVVALLLLVVRLMRGRPFFSRQRKRKVPGRED